MVIWHASRVGLKHGIGSVVCFVALLAISGCSKREPETVEVASRVVDVLDGSSILVPFGLPPRSGARVFQTRDKAGLLLIGGVDSLGKVRDDIWSLPLFGAGAFTPHQL